MSDPDTRATRVAVAVVSWNTRDLLARCLDSLHADVQSRLAEVWVVDNASSDGSAQLVRDRYPWVNLIASTENLGFGAAVNQVAARTVTAWVAPANADIALTPGALATLVGQGERHPEAGVLAPRLILPDGQTQQSVFPFPSLPFTIAYLTGAIAVSRALSRHWCLGAGFDPGQEREIPWAVGAFLVVRRSAWEQIGGFDEAQWMYAEDLDLGWRLRRAGHRARYVPAARVHHAESAATTKAWGGERYARWHASTYAWMARRRGWPQMRLIAGTNVIGFLLRAAIAAPAARAGHAGARSARVQALQSARAHSIGLRSRASLSRVR